MQKRRNLSSGTPWEERVAYSRAVRVGAHIHVSGTTATDVNGRLVGEGDAYLQTKQTLANVERALRGLGAGLSDVVRTRIFVVDMDDWEAVGRAHAEAFASVRPACTMLAVRALIDPRMRVEIEADAYLESEKDR